MTDAHRLTPAKRKRLLKTLGPCPAGSTNDDLERFLDLLYSMYSHVYTATELRHMVISDPLIALKLLASLHSRSWLNGWRLL